MITRKSKWETVGEISVDAGMVIVGDPCYFATPDADQHPAETWEEFCELTAGSDATQLHHKLGHAGLGVVVRISGDGVYPVEVRRNEEGRIAEMRVRFI